MSCKPFQNKRLFDYSNLHFPTAKKMKTFHVLPSPQGCCCDDALRHRLHSPAYPMCYVQVSTYCMFPIFQMFHNLLPLSPPSHFHLHLLYVPCPSFPPSFVWHHQAGLPVQICCIILSRTMNIFSAAARHLTGGFRIVKCLGEGIQNGSIGNT